MLLIVLMVWLPYGTSFGYNVDGTSGATQTRQPYDEAKLALVGSHFDRSEAPASTLYRKTLLNVLGQKVPILPLVNITSPEKLIAQELVMEHPEIRKFAFDPSTNNPFRVEVMSIFAALPGDLVGKSAACGQDECYRANLYNFFFNVSTSVLVNVVDKTVVSINSIRESQPELSNRLKELAVAIAKYEPAVQHEIGRYLAFLGDKKRADDIVPVMANTKSALKNTHCERSKHLCVAPTYVLGDKAMWVIVDLTDMKVVGVRWTSVGESGPPTVMTERILENEYVFKNFCQQVNSIERDGWSFKYHITTSDGLRLANAKYEGKPIFSSAKVVDWHVSYSKKDTFGYSDATGCPMFSSAVVVAFDGPKIEPILDSGSHVGFSISQFFQQQSWPSPCNYRYEERYEFYKDGRYRVALKSHGRGCGNYGTYRPVFRMDLGKSLEGKNYTIERWADSWKPIDTESWVRQREPSRLADQKYSHRILDENGKGYKLAPSSGQFGDGGRGDNAYIYVTALHPMMDEGDQDLVTLGSCCNNGHKQGPEQFMQPAEPLKSQQLVLWYVPQMKNDDTKGREYCWAENVVEDGVLKTKTWPCTAGPMFVPYN